MIVIFLTEHLITNSQAALWFGDDGIGFVRAVNFIHHLPYLQVVEISLIGIPILFHGVWGIRYAITSKANNYGSNGSKPALGRYGRNHAYSWQRLSSWVLLVGIIAHVWYMRFYRYPMDATVNGKTSYFNWVSMDPGLYTVTQRMGVKIYTPLMIAKEREKLQLDLQRQKELGRRAEKLQDSLDEQYAEEGGIAYSERADQVLTKNQLLLERIEWLRVLTKHRLSGSEVMIEAPEFGIATLLMVRDAFKSPIKGVLYTIFVAAAAFHAFNGLWTFFISWGTILRMRSQRVMVNVCVLLMLIIGLLGLAAVWGTYWINLRG